MLHILQIVKLGDNDKTNTNIDGYKIGNLMIINNFILGEKTKD